MQTAFAIGDWVYVYNPRRYRNRLVKWSLKYDGQYEQNCRGKCKLRGLEMATCEIQVGPRRQTEAMLKECKNTGGGRC